MKEIVIFRSSGVCGLLGVVFVTLKLIGIIDWSWLWVTAPFWGPIVLGLALVGFAGIMLAISIWANTKQIKNKKS